MPTTKTQFMKAKNRSDIAQALGISTSSLTYFAHAGGRRYKTFTIPKRSGGERQIDAPIEGLLSVQRKLATILSDIYPRPRYVKGFVAKESIATNASVHLGKRHVLNLDLQDFFPTITSARVFGLFRARPFYFNSEIATTLAALVTYNGRLPQGAPTSPIISNMICLRLDKELCALGKSSSSSYTRYADDITFSTTKSSFSSSVVKEILAPSEILLGDELIKVITSNDFAINTRKTRLQSNSDSKSVTGVRVNQKLNLTRDYVRELRAMIHSWKTKGYPEAQRLFTAEYHGGGRELTKVIEGKLAHLKNIKGIDDPVYRRLYNRFADAEGKSRPQLPLATVESIRSKVFIVKSENGSQGTGFVLDGKWLITCDHVLHGERNELEYFLAKDWSLPGHKKLRILDEWRSPLTKLDLLAVPLEGFDESSRAHSFDLAPDGYNIKLKTQCKLVGFPQYSPGVEANIDPLTVTGFRDDRYGTRVAYVNNKMVTGSSGSPVLNKDYQVIGVARTGTRNLSTGDDSIGYTFLPLDKLRDALTEITSRNE